MKRTTGGILAITLIVGGLSWVSCGNSKKKLSPEEEVSTYGKYFIDKISSRQLDSLTASYPDLAKADSIVALKSDTVTVVETMPGRYDLTIADGVVLKVIRSDDGTIAVTESRGLFAYPQDKVEIATKSGLWDEKLNDAQLSERMKDNDFFDYIKKTKTFNSNDIISIGKVESNDKSVEFCGVCDGHFIITNLTDVPINGEDYEIVNQWSFQAPATDEDDGFSKGTTRLPGKFLPPHGTARYDAEWGFRVSNSLRINWKLPYEQLKEKFLSFTGHEYQDYLDTHSTSNQ